MDEFEQENYRSGKKNIASLSMKQIILEQVKKVMEIGSKEFRGGYQEETIITIDGQPQIIKKYIEDGRQAYCNAVLSLNVTIINYVIDREKEELLKDHKYIKDKLTTNHQTYLKELKIERINKQEVKYKYLSKKRKICEELFSELMFILKDSNGMDEEEDGDTL